MNSKKSFSRLSHHLGIAVALLLSSSPLDGAEAKDQSSYYRDADQYTDTHEATKFDPSEKKLFFFAGPHKSGSTSVESFFSKWAKNGLEPAHPHTRPLKYWRWPLFDESQNRKQYGWLVKNQLDGQTSYLDHALDVIDDKFRESDNGVFLGTEEFDQVGPDKFWDAMPVMEAIVERLGVDHKDIKVVLNYRSPRADQWVSIWKHAGEDYENASYEDFMCKADADERDRRYRFSMIGAEMNPLNAAKNFLDRGWRVDLLDMGGIAKEGKHLVHTIGCDILLADCDGGVLSSLSDYMPQKNAGESDFNFLDEEETAKVEQLFRSRDCAYRPLLQKFIDKGQLTVLYQDSLWADCTQGDDYYQKFMDNTEMIYKALLGQLGCQSEDPDGSSTTVAGDAGDDTDIDAALADDGSAEGNVGEKLGGGGFNALFFVLVLLAAVGYGAHQVLQHNGRRRREALKHGGGGDPDGARVGTEMTTTSRFGNYRDDDQLEGDVSDQGRGSLSQGRGSLSDVI